MIWERAERLDADWAATALYNESGALLTVEGRARHPSDGGLPRAGNRLDQALALNQLQVNQLTDGHPAGEHVPARVD